MINDRLPKWPIVTMTMFSLIVIGWLAYLAFFGFGGNAPKTSRGTARSVNTSTPSTSMPTTSVASLLPEAVSEAAPPYVIPTSLAGEVPRSTVPEVSRAQRSRSVVAPVSTTTSSSVMASETPTTEAPTPETVPPDTPEDQTSSAPSTEPESSGWSTDEASWYGPGLYGNSTACGQRYTDQLPGVAHRTLPCGTLITFRHGGNEVTVPVIDRGPYVRGRIWDLSARTCRDLGHCYTGPVDWRRA